MNLIASTKDQESALGQACKETETTCPYCGVGCGVKVKQDKDSTTVAGRESHPANQGKLCVKGSALHETIGLEGRLLKPIVNGETSSWDHALSTAADFFTDTIKEHGPDSVAFYLSGQLLTEDYYVANKLMKGFIGSANIDTNSRLCMASAVVAHKRAFGADVVPGCYEDLEKTDVLFFVGSNAAYAHPIVFQRIMRAKKERGMKVVVLDPRRTATCDIADLHIALKPGTDAFFYNGLLTYLAENNKLDSGFIADNCEGFEDAIAQARAQVPDPKTAAEICDVDEDQIEQAYRWFAEHDRVVSMFSQGINQSSSGVDKGNALINCHLATGKIGREGATPFSITGQPNAMGGREVGGLANQLAAHMSFEAQDVNVVKEFWQAENMATSEGLKAVDLFDAVHEGKVKAIWIMGTNPVVSMPNANKVKEALAKCEMVVVSDCMADTDTTRLANVVFPSTTWGEKQGSVTNSERTISIQKPFLAAPGEAKNDWEIISEFAAKMGFKSNFNYEHGSKIFAEHAALSGYKSETNTKRAFNISQFADINQEDYENLAPIQWPVTSESASGTKRLFSDGKFFTSNGKARFVPIEARLPKVPPKVGQFIMNTGRIRDQWHTMTRTGKSAKLLSHTSEPFIQIHPSDAEKLSVEQGDLLQCEGQESRYIGRAKITKEQRQNEVFLPMHWNSVFASEGRVGALVFDIVDPLCGQPEFKHSPISIKPYKVRSQGLFIVSETLSFHSAEGMPSEYWNRIKVDNGNAFYFADQTNSYDWETWLKDCFPGIEDWVSLRDGKGGFRILGFSDNKLKLSFLFDSDNSGIPDHNWLASKLEQAIELEERFTLLAAEPGDDSNSPGPIVCSCFQIGENQIKAEIENGADTVEKLGKILKCGTNCGSCIPEISSLL